MINSQELKRRMKQQAMRQQDLANELGIRQSSLNLKINNLRPMMLHEAEIIAEVLNISNSDFGYYFFWTGVA